MNALGPALEIVNLRKSFGGIPATNDVCLKIMPGERRLIIGPNGAGKTTLFNQITGDFRPTSGRILLFGQDITTLSPHRRAHLGLSRTYQIITLFPQDTLEHNIMLGLLGLRGTRWNMVRPLSFYAGMYGEARRILDLVGLGNLAAARVGEVAYGQKRRVEIAKALLHRPQVLLMDEASTGLDPAARRDLSRHVENLRQQEGVTVLLTTHVLEEADRCDRLVMLHKGSIVTQGTPGELRSRIGGDVVVLETAEGETLAGKIRARFGVEPNVVDSQVRIEIANGHRFITEVVEAFPGEIDSVGLHKPTLEDVFVRETGASIDE